MGNAASIAIRGDNAPLKGALNESHTMLTDFGGKVKGVMQGIAAAFAIKEAFNLGKFFVDAASDAEDSQAKLEQAIRAPGYAAGFTAEQLSTLADRLQDVTKFEGDATKESLALLSSFNNIRGDVFIDATEAAMDMAQFFGTDLNSEILKVGKALNNPLEGLQALGRAGIQFTDSQKNMIESMVKTGDVAGAQNLILKELQTRYGGSAAAAAETFSGQQEIIKNKLGDVAETIGGMLIPVLQELGPIIDTGIVALQRMTPVIEYVFDYWVDFSKSALATGRELFEYIAEGSLQAFTGFQLVLVEFGGLAEREFLRFQLAGVENFEVIKHLLTETAPQYLDWFGKNWMRLFSDIANFQGVVLANMGENLKDFFTQVMRWLKGEGFDFEFTALTEGFKSTVDQLPEIAARIPSELEQQLGEQFNQIDRRLNNLYSTMLEDNRRKLQDLFKPVKIEAEIEIGPNTAKAVDADQFKDVTKTVKVKTTEEKDTIENVNRTVKETTTDKEPLEPQTVTARFEGLDEANRRIQQAAASLSTQEDGSDKIANSNDKLVAALDNTGQTIQQWKPTHALEVAVKPSKDIMSPDKLSDADLLTQSKEWADLDIPEIPIRKTDLELLTDGIKLEVPPHLLSDLELLTRNMTFKPFMSDTELLTGQKEKETDLAFLQRTYEERQPRLMEDEGDAPNMARRVSEDEANSIWESVANVARRVSEDEANAIWEAKPESDITLFPLATGLEDLADRFTATLRDVGQMQLDTQVLPTENVDLQALLSLSISVENRIAEILEGMSGKSTATVNAVKDVQRDLDKVGRLY